MEKNIRTNCRFAYKLWLFGVYFINSRPNFNRRLLPITMFALIGLVLLFGSLLFGYTMHGGQVAVLMQVSEFIILGGAAFASIVIAEGFGGVKTVISACLGLLKGSPCNRKAYLELLQMMYEVFMNARKEGLVSLEKHVDNPKESEILSKYPTFISNHEAVAMFTDTLKLVAMGGITPYNLSDLMDADLEMQEEEVMKPSHILATVGDAMPAFGIVAAVLGVVITMQAINGPPEEIGHKVAAALVGTFLGVLMAYGVFAPLSKATEHIAKSKYQYLLCIKSAVVAFARGDVPLVCAEFARRSIELEIRPSFDEMEQACKNKKTDAPSSSTSAASAEPEMDKAA